MGDSEEKDVSPPYSNRGVVNTAQNGLRACVDWLQVTFKNSISPQNVFDLIGLDSADFTDFETGKYGYHSHKRFGHIALYYSDNLPHIHLEISGQGCREYEQFGKYDWVTMLGLILMLDVNITRLDLAIDDFSGYFKFKTLIRKVKKGHVNSRFKKAQIREDIELNDGSVCGTTLYFGSVKSDVQVRIYDKLQERVSKGYTIQEGIEVWNRTEIQLRDKRALRAAYELVNNIQDVGTVVQAILRNYVKFVDEKKNDTNKARWPISKFWLKFLDNVEPLKLSQVAPDATIERVKRWFEHSVSANFALLYEAFDNNEELVREWLKTGKEKQNKKHKDMLKRFKAEKEVDGVSLKDLKATKGLGISIKELKEHKQQLMREITGGRVHKPVKKEKDSQCRQNDGSHE